MRLSRVKTLMRYLLLMGSALALLYVIHFQYDVFNISHVPMRIPLAVQKLWIPPINLTQSSAALSVKPPTPTLTLTTPKPTPARPSPSNDVLLESDATEAEVLEQTRSYTNSLPNTTEVSVVTAYFNLGPLNKKSEEGKYTPDLYKRWMATFRWLDNPLVVFVDQEDTATYFRQLRAHYPPSRTTIILVQRKELWAFQLEPEIKKIYSQRGYPRHPPNTINALYSCAMHAKFELVQKVVRERMYQTRFVAWLDIGLFRSEAKKNKTIHLTVPTDFKRTHVGYSQVNKFVTTTPADVIRRNMVWVGGASFLATPEVIYVYCSDYRRAVRKLLVMKWMSTDQQVIYSMFQPSFNFTRRFQLQAYTQHIGNSWFSMGYQMKEAP